MARTPKKVELNGTTYYVDENNQYYTIESGKKTSIGTPSKEVVDALEYSEIYDFTTSGSKIKFKDPVIKFRREKPPRALPTTVNVPERADRLEMPLIGESVAEEIKKLTLELINNTQDLLNADLNYQSIDFVPEYEIGRTDDEESFGIYFEEEFINDNRQQVPDEIYSDLQETARAIKKWVRSKETSFWEYANNFSVTYNPSTGQPSITATVPVSNGIIEEIGVIVKKRRGGEGVRDTNV
jgi:hypothetical protein